VSRKGRCCDVANHKEQIDVDSWEAFAQQFAFCVKSTVEGRDGFFEKVKVK